MVSDGLHNGLEGMMLPFTLSTFIQKPTPWRTTPADSITEELELMAPEFVEREDGHCGNIGKILFFQI